MTVVGLFKTVTSARGACVRVSRVGPPRPQHDVDLAIPRDQVTKHLAIAVPELFATRSSSNGPPEQTGHDLALWQIVEDDHVRSAPQQVSYRAVVAVAHPSRLFGEALERVARTRRVVQAPVTRR